MTRIALESNSSGTGTFTITAPVSNTSSSFTLPTTGGEIVTNSSNLSGSSDNRIINGAFNIWQRATSSSSFGYVTADRWRNSFVGGTSTQSQQTFTLGTKLGKNNPKYFLRQEVSGQSLSTQYAAITQRIEDVQTHAGETVTILGWARRSGGTGNVSVEAFQYFGTSGSPSTSVSTHAGLITLTTGWEPFAVTVAIPSVTGKTLGTDLNDFLEINFWLSAGSDFNTRSNSLGLQTITADFWGIHIKPGTHTVDSTDFYIEPPVSDELIRCQRYFSIVRVSAQSPVIGSILVPWYTPVNMYKNPTLVVSSAGSIVTATAAQDVVSYNGGGYFQATASSNGGYVVNRIYNLTAEL